ncbi:PAAR domain-containing protein [Paraburkholderia sp. J67]|uniref:PAAR domain-containing protein n=1 Tax=Paraburkholderia sp. J67 TaxID=2805435 RepID=UPI002ABD3C0B|nr:PAAR domain-containing protein [Paraburkholderia sp. J67]
MMRRIAVVGDELSGGGRILDYEQRYACTYHGHKTALLGKEAFCETCRNAGRIVKNGEAYRWNIDGTENALDGDIVLCHCPTPPRITAKLAGESWCEVKSGTSVIAECARSASVTDSQILIHDEQFALTDGMGRPLSNTYYTVRYADGSTSHGETDDSGRTLRHRTDAAERIAVYLGHREA